MKDLENNNAPHLSKNNAYKYNYDKLKFFISG